MQNKKKVYLIISIVSFSIVLAALAAIGGLLLAYKRQSDNYEQLAAAARTAAPAAPTTPATEAVEETQPVETEPPLPTDHPLLHCPNTIVTPHIAFASVESMEQRADIVFNNLYSWLDGKQVNAV